jgi:hypothetical protein
MYKFTELFGWCNVIPALISIAIFPWLEKPVFSTKESIITLLLLQIMVGGAMVYSSKQKLRGTNIGDKIYPASIASYILLMLVTYRWFSHGG